MDRTQSAEALSRAIKAEELGNELSGKLDEIKNTLKTIEQEVKVDLREMSSKFNASALNMQSVLVKLEERDRQYRDMANNNAETFNRFGNSIQTLSEKIHEIELSTQKIKYFEVALYSLWIGFLSTFGWLLTRYFG